MHYQWGFWQMKYANRVLIAAGAAAVLSACSTGGNGSAEADLQTVPIPQSTGVSDTPVKIGEPYQVAGTTYTPADIADYDQVGYASFYGQELAGSPTANGELFNPAGISAAHKTLPLPSYVEVTALDSGKTILVRINDRGPFAKDRLIDLSEGAARQLGLTGQGVSGVRVRKVNPPEPERAALRNGRPAEMRIETPDSLLVVLRDNLSKLPKPQAVAQTVAPRPGTLPGSGDRFVREGGGAGSPAPVSRPPSPGQANGRFVREGTGVREGGGSPERASLPTGNGYVVQIASFSSKARADALARKLGAKVTASNDKSLFRVHYGPYGSESEAQKGLETAKQRGYPNARVFRQ
jgi:rare lipoprotein A